MHRIGGTLLTTTALAMMLSYAAYGQDAEPFEIETGETIELETIYINIDNFGRPLEETSAGNTVISGELAERARNLDIRSAVNDQANVDFEAGPSLPVIRGIDGSAGLVSGFALFTGTRPRVSVLVDGVARQANIGGNATSLSSTWDLNRIEVARGPQTTKAGRSSLAGAINIITNEPVFDNEAALRARLYSTEGDFNYGASMIANAELVPGQVAGRLSADGVIGASFINITDPNYADVRDDIEDESDYTVRARLLATPDALPGFKFGLNYETQRREGLFWDAVTIGSTDFNLEDLSASNEQISTSEVLSAAATYDINNAWQVEALVAGIESTYEIPERSSEFLNLNQETKGIQAEGLARYTGDRFIRRFVGGVSYETNDETVLNDNPFFEFSTNGELINSSVFGEVELALSDRFFLELGGRYENEENKRNVSVFGVATPGDFSSSHFTPRAGLRYQVSDLSTIGYQYSEGYRAGSIDVSTFDQPGAPAGTISTFDGETLHQHEIWMRHAAADGRFEINSAAFYHTFDNAQVPGAGPGDLIGNLPSAIGYGLEVEAGYQVVDKLRVRGSVGLLNTEIDDAGTDPNTAPFQGQQLPASANLTLALGMDYEVVPELFVYGLLKHTGERSPYFLGGTPAPAYTTIDVGLNYQTAALGQSFEVEAFVTNLFDENVIEIVDQGFGINVVGRPRTIGLSATMRF